MRSGKRFPERAPNVSKIVGRLNSSKCRFRNLFSEQKKRLTNVVVAGIAGSLSYSLFSSKSFYNGIIGIEGVVERSEMEVSENNRILKYMITLSDSELVLSEDNIDLGVK